MPIIILWFLDYGFSQFQITLLLSSFFLMATVTEVPSGLFSDRMGHKWGLVVSGVASAVGLVILAFPFHFFIVLAGEILAGVGYAFYTGTKEAYLFNYLQTLGKDSLYQRHYARSKFYEFLGIAAASLIGGSLFSVWKQSPFYLAGMAMLAASFLVAFFPSTPTAKSAGISHFGHLWKGLQQIVHGAGRLRVLILYYCLLLTTILLLVVVIGQPYLREIGIPLHWFGVLYLLFNVAAMGGSEWAHRLGNRILSHRFFFWLAASFFLLLLFMSWIQHPVSILLIFLFYLFWGLFFPTVSDTENRLIPFETRGTILSAQDFLQNLSLVGLAPLLGLVSDHWGIFCTSLVLSLVPLVAALLALRLRVFD